MKTGVENESIDELLQENHAWQNALDGHLQENAFLKIRLSQVLDLNTKKDFVVLAERLQNSFIYTDDCIKDIKRDIVELQNLLRATKPDHYMNENKLAKKQQKMRNEIGYFEKNFMLLKDEFNQYIIQSMIS